MHFEHNILILDITETFFQRPFDTVCVHISAKHVGFIMINSGNVSSLWRLYLRSGSAANILINMLELQLGATCKLFAWFAVIYKWLISWTYFS